jgi:hypothetical protein
VFFGEILHLNDGILRRFLVIWQAVETRHSLYPSIHASSVKAVLSAFGLFVRAVRLISCDLNVRTGVGKFQLAYAGTEWSWSFFSNLSKFQQPSCRKKRIRGMRNPTEVPATH